MNDDPTNDVIDALTRIGLNKGADKLRLNDNFPHETQLITHDGDVVAQLDLEDSGYGPLVWSLGIMVLKQARKQQDAGIE